MRIKNIGLLPKMYVNLIEVFYYVVHNTKWNENPAQLHAGEERFIYFVLKIRFACVELVVPF